MFIYEFCCSTHDDLHTNSYGNEIEMENIVGLA